MNAQGCWRGQPKHHDGPIQSSPAQDIWRGCKCPVYSKGCKEGLVSFEDMTFPVYYDYQREKEYKEKLKLFFIKLWKDFHHTCSFRKGKWVCCDKEEVFAKGNGICCTYFTLHIYDIYTSLLYDIYFTLHRIQFILHTIWLHIYMHAYIHACIYVHIHPNIILVIK